MRNEAFSPNPMRLNVIAEEIPAVGPRRGAARYPHIHRIHKEKEKKKQKKKEKALLLLFLYQRPGITIVAREK